MAPLADDDRVARAVGDGGDARRAVAVEDPGVLAQRAGAVVVRRVEGAGLGADLADAVHADVVAPRERVDDVRGVVAAGIGRVGRVLEDRDDRGPGVRRAEVDGQRGQAARVVLRGRPPTG